MFGRFFGQTYYGETYFGIGAEAAPPTVEADVFLAIHTGQYLELRTEGSYTLNQDADLIIDQPTTYVLDADEDAIIGSGS